MKSYKILIPLIILVFSGLIVAVIFAFKPEPVKKNAERVVPKIEVIQVESSTVQLKVKSQGNVIPGIRTVLTAEVSGRVISVSPKFKNGEFFNKGEELLRIDPADYSALHAKAKANVASAKLKYNQELALASQAKKDWSRLGRKGEASELTLRKPQIEYAKALHESAVAALEKAGRDLSRTVIMAPYAGRIHDKSVDVGQFIAVPGTAVATVYATDYAEIRLPLTDKDMSQLDFIESATPSDHGKKSAVKVSAVFGGKTYNWAGVLERAEAVVDFRTRMHHAIVRVENPYSQNPPLKVGMFVEVLIDGKMMDEVYTLPRSAMVGKGIVLVLDDESKLYRRKVEILQSGFDKVLISSGLKRGEYVCVTPLEYAVNGLQVEYSVNVKE